MPLAFRIRFVLGRSSMISSPSSELPIADPLEQKEILLKASGRATISDAETLALHGRPFESEQEAFRAANRWVGVLQKGLAHLNVGADFGDRAPPLGRLSPYGLEMFAEETGATILNDVHGVSIYEYPPEPRFAGIGSVNVKVGPEADRVIDVIAQALKVGAVMTGPEQLSYEPM